MSIEGLGLRSPLLYAGAAASMAPVAIAGPPAGARSAPRGPMMKLREAEAPDEVMSERRPGVLERAADKLFGTFRFTQAAIIRDLLRGRIIRRDGDMIVIGLEVLAAFDWDEAALAKATVVVELDDGSTIDAEVVVAESTRGARLQPGQRAKLTLKLHGKLGAAAPSVVRITDLGLQIPLT